MAETIAEKNARLRALREARDGTKAEQRERAQAVKAYNQRVRNHNFGLMMDFLRDQLDNNPEGLIDIIVSDKFQKALDRC